MTKSSLFSPMSLVVNENLSYSNTLASHVNVLEGSYFLRTLTFLKESRQDFNNANKTFYKAVLESQGDEVLVHESFSGFFDVIRKIIDKVIEFIKSLFNKFITALHMAFKNEKYLVKHKEDFKKFESSHNFKFEGYEFTFCPSIPSLVTLETFASSLSDIKDIATSSVTDSAQVNTALKNKYDAFMAELEDKAYDLARASVIGKADNETVYQSDFANELFLTFRNNANSKEDIEVNSSYVTEAYSRFENSKKLETAVKKDKDRIEKEYKAIRKQIDSAVKRSADGGHINISYGDTDSETAQLNMNKDVLSNFDLFIKAKSNQLQQLSDIHSLAFAAKLDAINDCFKQDKTVLYKALYKIQGVATKGGN